MFIFSNFVPLRKCEILKSNILELKDKNIIELIMIIASLVSKNGKRKVHKYIIIDKFTEISNPSKNETESPISNLSIFVLFFAFIFIIWTRLIEDF
tara:strand:- start:251 stop:538 length:288 start_codon:yes stop_codon:yes gene_type:complete